MNKTKNLNKTKNRNQKRNLLPSYIYLGMKMTMFIFFASMMVSFGNVHGQLVSLDHNKVPLKKVLVDISKKTGYTFMYDDKEISSNDLVSIKVENAKLPKVLNTLFEDKSLGYRIEGRSIALYRISSTWIAAPDKAIAMQQLTVKGRVVDESGQPLAGASVGIKGTTQGTVSDADGNFVLRNVPANATIMCSYIGMKIQEIELKGRTTINITLASMTTGLESIVVIGYGTVQRKDLTGSVSTIKAEDIANINTPSLNDALQGMTSGVQVTAQTGQPGEASQILIRGGSSISASNEPLYVIDGFPQLGGNNLDLNPQDIESIDILKDASAGAIYGARASNGVVLITTKSGKKGSLDVSYSGKSTFSNIIKKLETVDIVDYAKIQAEMAPSDRKFRYADPEAWRDTTSIDWQDAVYRTALLHTHDLSISGGSDKTRFSASLGYHSQEGIAIGSDFSRLTSRLKVDSDISKKFKAGTNLSLSYSDRGGPTMDGQGGIGLYILRARPYIVGGPISGDLAEYVDPDFSTGQETTNPIKWLTEQQAQREDIFLRSNSYLEYEPIKALKLKANGAMTYFSMKNKSYTPSDVGAGMAQNGSGSISQFQRISQLFEATAEYKYKKGKHDLQPVIGFSAQTGINENVAARSTNFPIENLGYNNLSVGESPLPPTSNKASNAIASFFGRVNYGYRNRYLLTASLRADGSSNMGINNKWGYFPSAAFAWKVSEEKLIKDISWLSNLKLRTSYGVTGNNSIGNYVSMMQYSTANISVNSNLTLGMKPGTMANIDLKWERNEQLDLGIDIGLIKNKLNITADYYRKRSSDLLLNAPVPYYSGFSIYTSNVGQIQSTGYEFEVKANILNKKFKWNSAFNITFPQTKVLKLTDADHFYQGNFGHKLDMFIVRVGDPLGAMYGYVFDGVNQNIDEVNNMPQLGANAVVGGPRYKDISGPDGVPDGVVDTHDKTVIGNGHPDWFGGFTNRFSYQNFDFSFIFTFKYGNEVIYANKNFLLRPTYLYGGLKGIMDAWRPDNPTNDIYAWNTGGTEFNNLTSWLVEDGSFLRLSNITLGYTLKRSMLTKLGIKRCRAFASADKILTWSNYSGYDPEVSAFSSMLTPGVDPSSYPNMKSVTFGLNLMF